jgi:hypothetical protein
MDKIGIGFSFLLFLGVVPGPIAAEGTPTNQATPEQFCDYSLVFDDLCEVRTNAPADRITMPPLIRADDADEQRVAQSASSKAEIPSPQR